MASDLDAQAIEAQHANSELTQLSQDTSLEFQTLIKRHLIRLINRTFIKRTIRLQ